MRNTADSLKVYRADLLTAPNTYVIMYAKAVKTMHTTTITNFRKNIYGMMENTVRYNEPVNVITKSGNAVILSEQEYNSMVETLYLQSVPGMREKLLANGAADGHALFVANHFSHNGYITEIEKLMPGFAVSYDSMEIDVTKLHQGKE